MATVRDITNMCRAGEVTQAYALAKSDLDRMPSDVWAQREVGWALYYLIKADAEQLCVPDILDHLEELKGLDQLNMANDHLIFDNVLNVMCRAFLYQEAYEMAKTELDKNPTDILCQKQVGSVLSYLIEGDFKQNELQRALSRIDELKALDLLSPSADTRIFDNVLFKLAEFIKNHIFLTDVDAVAKLSSIFIRVRDIQFLPSRGYSYLLQSILKFESWAELADFFDWWNLDNLSTDDYTPYVTKEGKKMMTLAERAFIANSKALLKQNDLGRIEEFLPKLDDLMNKHPEMMYPGYFYGKLLLKLGSDEDEALKVIIPFARKKATEFWVWQLLSDVYTNDQEKQLACLLRAVHCKTKEEFIGKVRIKLASLYIQNNQLDRARYQIDAVTRCYVPQGWRLPYEVDCWVHQPWINTVSPNATDPINYMEITNAILCEGTDEAVAVVTFVDPNSQKAALIYGNQLRMGQKLRFKVGPGAVLKINYIKDAAGSVKVLSASKTALPNDLDYAKVVEGTISKQDNQGFAFLRSSVGRCFVSPNVVQKYNVKHNDQVKALVVFDFDKKKNTWNWVCISIKK